MPINDVSKLPGFQQYTGLSPEKANGESGASPDVIGSDIDGDDDDDGSKLVEGISAEFDHAIKQLQDVPKKAQDKIPPDTIPNLQRNKQNSVSKSKDAVDAKKQAQGVVDGNDDTKDVVGGGSGD